MAEPQPTALCPVCGTRALVDPATGKVRAHHRKGGIPCDGTREQRFRRVVSRRDSAQTGLEVEADGTPTTLVRVRATCPSCGRLLGVGAEDFRLRQHRNRANKTCRGSGTIPEIDDLKLDGITVAEAKRRRKAALAEERRRDGTEPTGLRARLGRLFSRREVRS